MGPSSIQIQQIRVQVVAAVAIVVFALAVLTASASARAVDGPGLPTPNLTPAQHSAPAPPSSEGTGAATIAALIAGGVVFAVGGVLVFEAVSKRPVFRPIGR